MIINPKNDSHRWNCHYASFSQKFVAGILEETKIRKPTVLDPWNGYGTTTITAALNGIQSYGIDINPVAVIVAKARQYNGNDQIINKHIKSICQDGKEYELIDDDLLTDFFDSTSSLKIRSLAMNILREFDIANPIYDEFDELNAECAVLMSALFETIKKLYRSQIRNSNPTWTKKSVISFEKNFSLKEAYIREVKLISDSLAFNREAVSFTKAKIYRSDSRKTSNDIPMVDVVITSPPYCTRIDYAVSTKLELAILGVNKREFKKLRDECIGTSTIIPVDKRGNDTFGLYIRGLLDQIYRHESYASSGYYYKTYLQYFSAIQSSLKSIDSKLKNKSDIYIVVQDSFYKDIHIDLPRAYTELCKQRDWELLKKAEFEKKNSLSTIQKNRTGKKRKRVETVLYFHKK